MRRVVATYEPDVFIRLYGANGYRGLTRAWHRLYPLAHEIELHHDFKDNTFLVVAWFPAVLPIRGCGSYV